MALYIDQRCFNGAFYWSPPAKISGDGEILYQPKANEKEHDVRRNLCTASKSTYRYIRDTTHYASRFVPINLPTSRICRGRIRIIQYPGPDRQKNPSLRVCFRIWNFYVPWRFLSRSPAPHSRSPVQTVIRGYWDNPIYEHERYILFVCVLIMYSFPTFFLSFFLSFLKQYVDFLKALQKVSGYFRIQKTILRGYHCICDPSNLWIYIKAIYNKYYITLQSARLNLSHWDRIAQNSK